MHKSYYIYVCRCKCRDPDLEGGLEFLKYAINIEKASKRCEPDLKIQFPKKKKKNLIK
jgi:hypothetical protein